MARLEHPAVSTDGWAAIARRLNQSLHRMFSGGYGFSPAQQQAQRLTWNGKPLAFDDYEPRSYDDSVCWLAARTAEPCERGRLACTYCGRTDATDGQGQCKGCGAPRGE